MEALLDSAEQARNQNLTAGADRARAHAIASALEALRAGRPVAFPTETVWGLAAPARVDRAVQTLRAWKGRDRDQPMSVMVSDARVLAAAGVVLPELGRRLAEAFWPGPLTLVVACGQSFAEGIARGDGALGLRCSSHPVALALALAAEGAGLGPLTATSLNRSGEPPARRLEEARAICETDAGPHVFEGWGSDASGALPTTVVDLTGTPARILRWGGLDAAALAPFSDRIAISDLPGSPSAPVSQGEKPA